ncbi:aldo/keto reductase [Dactylosporangium aurantiacum]|uniref:Aldo/keto reductase n=1 Tax=Dactylosporangium aurantiacum TaxID=35754 RepID=A0A9Q9IE33_9ACTN|nr:aldo/keto reductase [Dactylosporangium aurantiacum]MDG6105225.1 aldo/keto reductase [Dactylosporangium aurantiacum]UWZ51739.1 aldo/keto reductase [Dactylosporangium aurantiacum]
MQNTTIGLGAMGMSGMYGPADRAESIATIRAAIDAGVTLIDTGDFYGMGHNELLIRDALRPGDRDKVRLSVKFGALRGPDNAWGGMDTRPAAIRNFLGYTLVRLGVDHVDVYRPARLDPAVPVEETVGALADLVTEGWIREIGLSEVGADVIRRAHAVHPIADLQIEYSLLSRGVEDDVLPTLRELGIGMTAYGVLSRGLLSGHWRADRALAPGDFRAHGPRFAAENVQHNLALVEALRAVADRKGVTVAQLAIGWVAAQGPDIVPLVGARTRERLAEALTPVSLTAEDLAAVEAAVPADSARGSRYPEPMMAHLGTDR